MKTKTMILLMACAAVWILTVMIAVDQVRTARGKLAESEKELVRLRAGLSAIGAGLERMDVRNEKMVSQAERMGELLGAGRTD